MVVASSFTTVRRCHYPRVWPSRASSKVRYRRRPWSTQGALRRSSTIAARMDVAAGTVRQRLREHGVTAATRHCQRSEGGCSRRRGLVCSLRSAANSSSGRRKPSARSGLHPFSRGRRASGRDRQRLRAGTAERSRSAGTSALPPAPVPRAGHIPRRSACRTCGSQHDDTYSTSSFKEIVDSVRVRCHPSAEGLTMAAAATKTATARTT